MITYGREIEKGNRSFSTEVNGMKSTVDRAMMNWQGNAATAASGRAWSEHVSATKIDDSVARLATQYQKWGKILSAIKDPLINLVDSVPASGMSVSDSGVVTAPRVPPIDGEGGEVKRQLQQQKLDNVAAGLTQRIQSLLKKFGEGETNAASELQGPTTDLRSSNPNSGKPPIGVQSDEERGTRPSIDNLGRRAPDLRTDEEKNQESAGVPGRERGVVTLSVPPIPAPPGFKAGPSTRQPVAIDPNLPGNTRYSNKLTGAGQSDRTGLTEDIRYQTRIVGAIPVEQIPVVGEDGKTYIGIRWEYQYEVKRSVTIEHGVDGSPRGHPMQYPVTFGKWESASPGRVERLQKMGVPFASG
ncbi:hypothetical protein GOARA_082_00890 [Gordonia araii NBRC 100433]|uniref:Uncharacterized protein n=2 Tax=Gordonia araii TaxID=263909 RepID=G7H775_9ACTN|nr:hypothetical protein GOARA_082_00890 [Gordonia araii NBRC 100433]